jgi:O-antigen/teichoic acid export membrane protein
LHTFIRRTFVWTIVCAGTAVAAVVVLAPYLSQLLFGSRDNARLLTGVALCLAVMILQHTLISLFNALRLFRVVSAMNFLQSILFASLALGLLSLDASVSSILIDCSAGCLVASLGALIWAWPALNGVDRPKTDCLNQSSGRG